MKNTNLFFNNSILSLKNFISAILYENTNIKNVSIYSINETSLFYYVTIKNFIPSYDSFQIYYKNNFIIINVIQKENLKNLLTSVYYLPDINIRNISHVYHDNYVRIKIPKIINIY